MNSTAFSSFLFDLFCGFNKEAIKVIDDSISLQNYVAINLSESNPDLKQFNITSSRAWKDYIKDYLQKHHAEVAFGGYLEKRSIYNRSSYFKNENPENRRNIHLGIDLWCNVNTKVLAALDGEIHSFKDNTNFGDYGPTIILKHAIKEVSFYTLYGHLSQNSLDNLKTGMKVKQGQTIAFLGDATINGDYAPHLHFQIVKDLQGNFGDYPGVCSQQDLEFYKQNCPDPNVLLKLV